MELSALIHHYGLWAVFVVILLEQFGIPIPTLPLLLIVGAAAATDPGFGIIAMVVATLASTLGGSALYMAGRRYGNHLLGFFCRLSLSPKGCIKHGLAALERVGPLALLMARFVPGLAAMAPALAGKSGMHFRLFLLSQSVAGALFASAGIGLGYTFHDTIEQLIAGINAYTRPVVFGLATAVAAWLFYVAIANRQKAS